LTLRSTTVSIREYLPDEHQAGFIGLRLVVKVGSDYRQKYFSFRNKTDEEKDALRKTAQKLNAEWNMERTLTQSIKERECREIRRTSSAYTTGVSGVKMKFVRYHKIRAGEKRAYYTPYFKVSGSTKTVRFDKLFNIKQLGYDMAWHKAISFYAEKKGFSSFSHLLERKPPVEQFYVIYRHQVSLGHQIPLRRLPNELDPKPVEGLVAAA